MAEEFDGAIGIDLGTTYSCVGVLVNDKIEIIPNDQGARTVPSYVAFTETERLIGDAAKNQGAMNPENTIFDAKRLIGRRMSNQTVKSDMKNWPFKVVDQDDKPMIKASYLGEDKLFSPEEISSMVLTKMKEIAEAFLGKTVKNAVITVPAYFNDSQRQATKDAGLIAGLNVLRIINEPTAAAIAYGLENKGEGERTVLIFDLGGGTFDVSLLTLDKGVFTVKATAGDTHLGGEDFDARLLDHLKDVILKKNKKDISTNMRAIRRLRNACEKAKRVLSTQTSASIDVDALIDGEDFSHNITRAKFEDLCADLFLGCLQPVERVLKDSGFSKERVDDIVLVGGSTRIPKVQSLLSEFFGGKGLNKSINPDEAVAYGAAVQASILCGKKMSSTNDLLLRDVVPLSLGIEMQGGVMAVVVPRNTSIPCRMTSMFTTTENNQTTVEFPVYEGERPFTKDNNLLGAFALTGILPLPRGKPELECVFTIDANGILSVSATDKVTGRKSDIVIQNGVGRLSSSEIDRMIKEAQKFQEEDTKKRETVRAREEYEAYLNQIQETAHGALVSKRVDSSSLDGVIADALEWLDLNADAEKTKILSQKRQTEKKINDILAKLFK